MYWLSFANNKGNLGVVLVEKAFNFIDAVLQVNEAKCNPGGEVRGVEFPEDIIPPEYKDAMKKLPRLKLLTKQELESAMIGEIVKMEIFK